MTQNSDVDKRGTPPRISLSKLHKICYRDTDKAETTFQLVADKVYEHTGMSWTWKYFHSLYRGTSPMRPGVSAAICHTYETVANVKKTPKDPRPPAIRFAYPKGLDPHKERARILEKLTPIERYYACQEYIDRKEKQDEN